MIKIYQNDSVSITFLLPHHSQGSDFVSQNPEDKMIQGPPLLDTINKPQSMLIHIVIHIISISTLKAPKRILNHFLMKQQSNYVFI